MQKAQTAASCRAAAASGGGHGRAAFFVAALLAAGAAASIATRADASQRADLTRVAVGYAPGAAPAARAFEDTLGVKRLLSLDELAADVVGIEPARSANVIAALRSFPGVRYVELDGRAYAAAIPDDEYWPQEWSPVKTDAPRAWDITTGSPSVVVAVVDTGVDATQPDLQGRVLPGYDFANGDADATDDQGHGTAVAGVVAAEGNNGIGVAGYCWRCRVLPVKVLGSDGSGFNSWVAAGILWAVDHGAKIVNASLGSVTDDLTLAGAAQYAVQHDVLVVAAAGNDGGSTLEYPAALPGVVSVSASDPNDGAYSFSNTGAALAAPGENLSTGLQAGYVSFLGTSSAAPVVSGAAGLAFSAAPQATSAQVAQALEATAVPSAGAVFGRVDVYASLHSLVPATPAGPSPAAPSTAPANPSAQGARAYSSLDRRGRLTVRRPRRTYTLRTAGGALHVTLSARSSGRVRLALRLVAPDGTSVAVRSGRRRLRLETAVDPARYRIVVSRRGRGRPVAYRLSLVFPAP